MAFEPVTETMRPIDASCAAGCGWGGCGIEDMIVGSPASI
jgi:hypothetical protein